MRLLCLSCAVCTRPLKPTTGLVGPDQPAHSVSSHAASASPLMWLGSFEPLQSHKATRSAGSCVLLALNFCVFASSIAPLFGSGPPNTPISLKPYERNPVRLGSAYCTPLGVT